MAEPGRVDGTLIARISGTWRRKTSDAARGAIEAILLAMVVFSPWAYGAVHTGFEFILDAGVFVLALLWGVRILCDGRSSWQRCPVSLGLAGLFLLGIWQTAPLNRTLLAHISPATASWYDKLIPAEREETPFGSAQPAVSASAGSTISFYPYVTRRSLQRILAVLLVFLVVRNNLESRGAFRRLAIAAVCNGAVMATFAFVQFFSSPRNLLYGTYPSAGMQVFGPFIYRNHFACYINLCIGMALGLLWSRRPLLGDANAQDSGYTPGQPPRRTPSEWIRGLANGIFDRCLSSLRLLQDPASMWLGGALVLMLSSVVFTLSRGGFLALVGGYVICVLIRSTSLAQIREHGGSLLIAVLVLGLLAWFDLARIEARYATIWEGTALQESRLALWSGAVNIVKDFPIWGTGFGTCQYVDPLYRTSAETADLTVDHLHNDHLELLVEGGAVGLLLGWLTLGLIFWRGWRAVRQGHPMGGLALGAMFSISTLALHGFGDFCISVPAITLLATVVAAHLCTAGYRQGEHAKHKGSHGHDPKLHIRPWRGMASLVGASIPLILGWLVLREGWTVHQAAGLRQATYAKNEGKETRATESTKDRLEEALRVTPDDADLRTELGDVCADLWRQHAGQPRLAERYLASALESYLHARDLAPILPGPQLGLALHAEHLTHADSARTYLKRVQLLAPADPTFWYYCGNLNLRMQQRGDAWKSWRRCLELSDRFLGQVLDRSAKFLSSDELIREVLPEKPSLLREAGLRLYPRSDQARERSPFLQKALVLLAGQATPLSASDIRMQALLYQGLGRSDDAVRTFGKALQQQPLQAGWRFELAQILNQEGRLEEARGELAIVLAQQPKHEQAYLLWTKVMSDLLQKTKETGGGS